MSLPDLLLVILATIISLALFVYCFLGVFRTRQVIDFNIAMMKRKGESTWGSSRLEKRAKNKSFYLNMRIAGVGGMLMALLFLFAIVHGILTH